MTTIDPILHTTAWALAKDAGMDHWSEALPQARIILEQRKRKVQYIAESVIVNALAHVREEWEEVATFEEIDLLEIRGNIGLPTSFTYQLKL